MKHMLLFLCLLCLTILLLPFCSVADETPSDSDAFIPETIVPDELLKRCADVTYGAYSHHTYYSSFCGMERGYSIYLPADYNNGDKTYPVIYLLHGIFGNEYTFTGDNSNCLRELFGNMAHCGLSKEAVIVFPDMYARKDVKMTPAMNNETMTPYNDFVYDLTECLMPHIEESYRVLTGKENTGLVGFSMGGRETLFITLQHPEKFGYVCAIAPAPGLTPGKDWAMVHPGQLAEADAKFAPDTQAPYVLLLCCGTQDRVVGTFPASYHSIFTRNEVAHIWWEVPGADHDNTAIRCGLYNFLRIAFRSE